MFFNYNYFDNSLYYLNDGHYQFTHSFNSLLSLDL